MLNDKGQVLTWQLTKGSSIAEVAMLLQSLDKRPSDKLKTVYVDDCCKLQNKIKNIFGPHVSVKLDLFHAVQRITKTIPKKHVHASQFLKELSLVFRSEEDCGDKRLFPTPSAEKLLENLDKFMTKWQIMTMKKPHCVHQKQFQHFRDYSDICNLDACLIYQLEQ